MSDHVVDYHDPGFTLTEAAHRYEDLQVHLLNDHRIHFHPQLLARLRELEGDLTRYRLQELNKIHDYMHELIVRGQVPDQHFHFVISEQEL
jgi:hypothetical protein